MATLPPIKFDPTIAIDISKEKKALDEKIWGMINTKGLSEIDREELLHKAAKLRSIVNDFPEEIHIPAIKEKDLV